MRYFGGKTRTWQDIANIIQCNIPNHQSAFISPFTGGAWIECQIVAKKSLSDKHPYLIKMYQELQKGWEPPTHVSKDQYDYIKNNQDENPALTGFVGFGCSFAGKWFGGYASDASKNCGNNQRNFCMNAYNSIMEKMIGLSIEDTTFDCKSYEEIIPQNSIIYCDPPYANTTQYSDVVGNFDSNKFWEIMKMWSKNNMVFISEYTAPKNFKFIWSKNVKLDIRDKNNEKQNRMEKLFVHENRINDVIL